MPRNTLIALAALLLFSTPALAKSEACGPRLQAFNEYEELDSEKKIVEKVSFFAPGEWSPDSAFEGVAVKADEDAATKVEFEIFDKKKKSKGKRELPVKAWGERKDFRAVENFDQGKGVFGGKAKSEISSYVVRLKLNGKVLCENAARPVTPSGH